MHKATVKQYQPAPSYDHFNVKSQSQRVVGHGYNKSHIENKWQIFRTVEKNTTTVERVRN